MTPEQAEQLHEQWLEAKTAVEQWKDYEVELRRRIIFESGLFDADKETGSQTLTIFGGKLKATKSRNTKVENKNGEAVLVQQELGKLGEVSAHKAAKLFTYSARLSKKVYDELTDDERKVVDPIITTTEATPSLTFEG